MLAPRRKRRNKEGQKERSGSKKCYIIQMRGKNLYGSEGFGGQFGALGSEEGKVIKSGTLNMRQSKKLRSYFVWTIVWRNFGHIAGIQDRKL
jgi:hypothetical protein